MLDYFLAAVAVWGDAAIRLAGGPAEPQMGAEIVANRYT
jgi:hypothetical protein